MKYHLLLPRVADVGSPIDVSQWNALLRSAAAYHAYRGVHSVGEITPARVARFLLLNRRFPRSVYLCVREIEMLLSELKARYGLQGGQSSRRATGQAAGAPQFAHDRDDHSARIARVSGHGTGPADRGHAGSVGDFFR